MTDTVVALRAFNRFHTRFVGALSTSYMGSGLTLAEARLLYEAAMREPALASEIQAKLGLDAGYVSRVVKRFEKAGLIQRARGEDARQRPISLTPAGRALLDVVDQRARQDAEVRLAHLDAPARALLVETLATARALLGDIEGPDWSIRPFGPGDLPLIAARQAVLYARDQGWGAPMEALLVKVAGDFLRDFKPAREQAWIADRAGRMLGAVLLADAGGDIAQLRLLHVEPEARGMGIRRALVDSTIHFAREAGYARIQLWTQDVLVAARRLYADTGFRRVSTQTHERLGRPERGEIWELALDGPGDRAESNM